jgi:hypothetical protein
MEGRSGAAPDEEQLPTLAEAMKALSELTEESAPLHITERAAIAASFGIEAMQLGFVLLFAGNASDGEDSVEICCARRQTEDVSPGFPELAKRLRKLADDLEREPRSAEASVVYDTSRRKAVGEA